MKLIRNSVKYGFYWIPVILWAILIFSFSSKPTGSVSEVHWEDFIVKKTAHVTVYFILTMLSYRALLNSGVSKSKSAVLSLLFSIAYGFTDEFHQGFTPGRDPRIRDVIFDTIGSTLFLYSIWKWLPKMPKKLQSLAKELLII